MSDAIVLDVADTTPVRLDVGDADPIAREEIAELAERVEAIEADYVTSEDVMGALGGEAPTLVAGSSRALLGDAETASWMERTTAADGAALIESVKGNTLRWNQLVQRMNTAQSVSEYGLTKTVSEDGSLTITGTVTSAVPYDALYLAGPISLLRDGRKYLFKLSKPITQFLRINGYSATTEHQAFIWSNNTGTNWNGGLCAAVSVGDVINIQNVKANIFDLTQMFGAGNEPATVAEFEALYPLPYYPYDHGSLLPVRMEGVETVAADESWSSQRTIPAATYFPNGLRSAGSIYDELRADAAVTRVGERAYQSGDESDASVITDGTVTHYALATPTTTPIDPPLNLTYRAEQGGTERITHTEQSALPVLSIAYGHTAEGIVQEAASAIAAQDGPTATTNHAVGSYLTMGGTLYRVTTAIATGEAITPGTNVMATTVMAEVLSLIQ